ncbi:hypothetical protein ACHAXT_004532 [Thalassiosira profunda]
MARKSKKKAPPPPPPAADDDGGAATSTEEESLGPDDDAMSVDAEVPAIDSDGESGEDDGDTKEATAGSAKGKKSAKKKGKQSKGAGAPTKASDAMPFMDTFYQLSDDAPIARAAAGRDLLRHCFPTGGDVNAKDAAYALTRLMNGLCTGRAASRQGFAACLASFLQVAHASGGWEEILTEDEGASKLRGERGANSAAIVRQKLLSITEFISDEEGDKGKKGKKDPKQRFGGKMKGIEERDHVFGRLFGISAVVRSGILGADDFPAKVVEGYVQDLIDLYRYKNWMREPAAHAMIELLSSIDANPDLVARVANGVLVPKFFLAPCAEDKGAKDVNHSDRAQWLNALTPEQIAVALHLQTPPLGEIEYAYPLDEPLVTAASIPILAAALGSTSHVVHPRCHVVWNGLWKYLTLEEEGKDLRMLRSNEEFPALVNSLVENVVLGGLLGKGEGSAGPTNERRSLALQLVVALCGASDLNMTLPPDLIGTVLCPEVVTRVFVNVLCASGGKKGKEGGVEHHLKPLTVKALEELVNRSCNSDDVLRRMEMAKAFLRTDPRFDGKTKTSTVGSLLMLDDSGSEDAERQSTREALWQNYLSFLEEEIVAATSLHGATVHIELMYKLAKRSLASALADAARRVVRFFMSGAFFDCSGLVDPSAPSKKSAKKKKKGKAEAVATSSPPQELSSGLRIKELLQVGNMTSVSHPARSIMSARFYSLLSDFVSVINSQNRGGLKDKSFYNGKGSKPESIYRALSEICGISTLLETSGAKMFQAPSDSMAGDDASDEEDPMEASKKCMLQLQNVANDALVKECGGSGDEEALRAKSVFATGCASLMLSLFLQLNSCGSPDVEGDEDEEEDVAEAVHEYISDLADCVDGLLKAMEDAQSAEKADEDENPLAALAGLLVNILSSPVGGEGFGKTSPAQASASKLTRETVKLAWSGTVSMITTSSKSDNSLAKLVDEDVMSILIESVCGEKAMAEEDEEEEEGDDSSKGSDSSVDDAVFVNATKSGMDLEEDDNSESSEESEGSRQDSSDEEEGDDDVELDPTKLENLLLEDSDAEMEEGGVLEHHAGADKALAQLIKLRQEARKASQTERERVELCNRLRCVGLLEGLFSASVFKSGWLPVEAVLGSIVPLLRARKAIGKSIAASTSTNAKKSLSEKNALMDRISSLVKDKISKFRCADDSTSEEVAFKAAADVFEELKQSLNVAHCSCSSVALIIAVRCIPKMEGSAEVKTIYAEAVVDWSTRKATKIHACAFHDLIQRMPSLAVVVLLDPLLTAASDAHSAFLKCESVKLLSSIYKHDTPNPEEHFSSTARSAMKGNCSKVSVALGNALGDSSLQKAKHREEVLTAIKHFVHFVKAQDAGILTDAELCALQKSLKGVNCKSAGMKQQCSQLSEAVAGLARRVEGNEEQKPKRPKASKTPKTSKKAKKSKKSGS